TEVGIVACGYGFFFVFIALGMVQPLLTLPTPGMGALLSAIGRLGLVLAMAVALSHLLVSTLQTLDANHRAMLRFVPVEYLRLLGRKDISEIQRGDEVELELTIFFADLRAFTSLSEKLGPRATFAYLNDYLAHVEPIIYARGGVICSHLG